jgi:hypothetical protein
MLEIGLEIHRWLWKSNFVLPILLLGLFRLVERSWRLGKDGASAYVIGTIYVALIAGAVPFLPALFVNTPFLNRFPVGPLQFDIRFVGAILVFAVFWVEPEIAQFKVLRGILKLGALLFALEVLAASASLPASQGLHPNALALRAVVWTMTVWSVCTIAVYVAYRSSMKPRQSLGFSFTSIGMLGLILAATLPSRWSLAMIVLLLSAYPYLIALGMHPPGELATRKPGELYHDGLDRLVALWRSWTS